jgi:anti-sigma B factor antagonist
VEVDMPESLAVLDSIAVPAGSDLLAFECHWTYAGVDVAWVRLAGELDIATARQLRRTLRESLSRARLVVLDLRKLAFMDSSGVHAIVNASACAREDGRHLLLLRGPPSVDRVFALAGRSDDVEIVDLRSLLARSEPELAR